MSTTELIERLEKAEIELATYREQVATLSSANKELRQRIDELCRKLYGKRSEQVDPAQLALAFAELEKGQAAAEAPPVDLEEADSGEPVVARKRRGHGRKAPRKDVPRVRVESRPAPEDCVCASCHADKVVIGEETSEQYDYVPASTRVLVHARLKMACPKCREGVVVAPVAEKVVDKGLASAGMIAHVIVSKVLAQ